MNFLQILVHLKIEKTSQLVSVVFALFVILSWPDVVEIWSSYCLDFYCMMKKSRQYQLDFVKRKLSGNDRWSKALFTTIVRLYVGLNATKQRKNIKYLPFSVPYKMY